MVVCDRYGSEPEFGLWKKNLNDTDGVVEPESSLTVGKVPDQSRDTEHPADSSHLTSVHTDTCT